MAPAYGEVKLAFVHHTENPNGYSAGQVPAMLRAIFLFHREVNGWHDIGYNFAIDRFGRVWEARAGGIDEPVAGAQAGGYNFVSTGVAVLGSFSGTRISAPARRSLQRLLAWKLSLHGIPPAGRVVVRVNPAGASYSKYPARARVSLPRIAGHRDADTTACPGDALYGQLPGIRRRVRRLTGHGAVRATLALVTGPSQAPAQPVPQPAPAQPLPQLLVTLARLDGTPVPGAPVQIQVRTRLAPGRDRGPHDRRRRLYGCERALPSRGFVRGRRSDAPLGAGALRGRAGRRRGCLAGRRSGPGGGAHRPGGAGL